MTTFEITTDMRLVDDILTHPAVYSRMVDDSAPPRESFWAFQRYGFTFVLARVDGVVAALFLIKGLDLEVELHFCFCPQFWGQSKEISLEFIKWIWSNTLVTKLIGPVPAHNRLALRLARAVGFSEVGVEHAAIQRHGKPCDLLLLELVRP